MTIPLPVSPLPGADVPGSLAEAQQSNNDALATEAAVAAIMPRVVRGSVNADGSIAAGAGFSVSKPSAGHYTVTFTTAFPGRPSVVVSPYTTASNVGNDAALDHSVLPSASGFRVVTSDPPATGYVDLPFDFVAVG